MSLSECPKESYFDSAQFNSILNHSAAIIDAPMNIFVTYLIVYKSSPKMKNMKSSLLALQICSTVSDFMLGTLSIPYAAHPVAGFSPTGLSSYTSINPGIQAYFVIGMIAEVGSFVIIMFENRYHHLARFNKNSSLTFRRFLIVLNIVAPWLVMAYSFSDVPDQTNIKDYVFEIIKCPTQDLINLPVFVITKTSSYAAFVMAFLVIFYTTEVVYFLTTTIHYLHNETRNISMSNATKKLERKFCYSVYAQTSIPILAIVVPGSYVAFTIYEGYYNQALNNISMFAMSVHGFFGSIATILIYNEYRLFTKNLLFGIKPEVTPSAQMERKDIIV